MVNAPWLLVTLAELGVKEIAGPEHHPRILEYLSVCKGGHESDETSWCSAFGCWALEQCGIKSPRSAVARHWLRYGIPVENPFPGCYAVLPRGNSSWMGHLTQYVGMSAPGWFYGCGGNQKNKVGIDKFQMSKVLGWRMPDPSIATW